MLRVSPALVTMACGVMASLATAAKAVPPIVDRIPSDAMAVIVIPNFDKLGKDISRGSEMVGAPLPMTLEDMMDMIGLSKGMKRDGPMALYMPALTRQQFTEGEPPFVMLLSATSFADLLDGVGAKPGAAGAVVEADLQGSPGFFKDLGEGLVALSPVKAAVENFSGKPGNAAAFRTMVGANGAKVAEQSPFSVILNGPKLLALADREEMNRGLQRAITDAPTPEAAASAKTGMWLLNKGMDEVSGLVLGARVDGPGIALESVVSFREGTSLAKAFAEAGNSGSLLNRVPGGAYLAAAALDVNSAGLKALVREIAAEANKNLPADKRDQSWIKSFEQMEGAASVVAVSPAGLMGGVLAATSSFTAVSDPAAAIKSLRESMEKQQAAGQADVKYQAGAADVNGVKVDAFEVVLKGEAAEMGAQVMTTLFGGPGPSGYLATTKGGYVQTFSKNAELMGSALRAANGDGPSIAADPLIKQIGDRLPKGRAAELYIGSKGILDTTMPLMGMFMGGQVNIDVPQNLPPIGLALTPGGGGIQGSIYLPGATLKVMRDLSQQVGGRGGQGGGEQPNQGGQPKF